MHAVIVTYQRPERLRARITKLPVDDLASVTIVDNAPSPESRSAAEGAATRLPTEYIALPRISGRPARSRSAIAHVLTTCPDTDWLLVVNDDGVPGGEGAVRRLRDFGEWLVTHGAAGGRRRA